MRLLLAAALVLIAAGCAGGPEGASSSQGRGQPPAGDSAMRVALAVVALERSEETAITAEQAAKMLPWLRVLRTMDPNDLEAARAIADEALAVLTPEQRAALEQMRDRAQGSGFPGGQAGPERRGRQGGAPGGPSGPGRAPGGGPGIGSGGGPGPGPGAGGQADPSRRLEFRTRALDRAIRILEDKTRPGSS